MLSRVLIKKQRGRRGLTLIAVAGLLATSIGIAGSVLAVHDEAFQLDGNVVDDASATAPFDWANFFNTSGQESPVLPDESRPGFTAAGFDRDFNTNDNGTFNTNDGSTFSTGSKDTLPITPGWQCGYSANVNAKTDIMNTYAVSYTVPPGTPDAGDEILYFGLERNTNTGTGNVGFWFLQDEVSCEATSTSGNQAFSGDHVDGDILVVSEFSNGGAVATIKAYRWDGGANGALNPDPVADGASCALAAGDDSICASVNLVTITTPWLTASKQDGAGHSLRVSEFFEAGLNLTDRGLGGKCFSTFMGVTRSSTSLTATIFDYALGQLGECTSGIDTTPSTGSNSEVTPGTSVRDNGTITVTGTDDTFGGTVSFYLCGPTAIADPYVLCATGGTVVNGIEDGALNPPVAVSGNAGTASVQSSPITVNDPGRYCWRAVYSGDASKSVPGSSDFTVDECFRVAKLNPMIVTTSSQTGNVTPGTSVTDTATVSGAGPTPTGTVDFILCQPSEVTTAGCPTGAGTKIGATKTLNASGAATSDAASGTATTTLGKYCWRAEYGGDGTYNSGSHTNAGSECFTVRTSTSGTTVQNWLPNDRITVSSASGNVSGTLSIQLIEGTLAATCAASTGTVRYTEPVTNPVTATEAGTVIDTTNGSNAATTFRATATWNYFWKVAFTPTSSFADGFVSCETTSLTINNNP